jgi:starch synthase
MRAVIGFDPALAQRIYAGADFFLMPSEFEPCGLAQMIALRYGTIPIVRATGGLADTVIPFNHEDSTGNGVNFRAVDPNDMADAVWRAICIFNDKKQFAAIKKNAMSGDYSWTASAKKYLELYDSII